MQKVLFIGLVWPEPTSSAAGWRILQLINFFKSQKMEIHFASSAKFTEHSYPLENDSLKCYEISINDSNFNTFISELQPNIVVFDRFITEEQFGWRVRKECPNALTILDTEDVHFVRKAREVAYKKNTVVNYFTEDAKRELTSIYRCDLSLIISEFEYQLLTTTFSIPKEILFYLPFIHDTESTSTENPPFEERCDFMFIGNFWHEPNFQTVKVLKEKIWNNIRKKIPNASLYIYGAYSTPKVEQLHQPKDKFYIVGRAKSVKEVMQKHRVLLAPIPFGAGLKGKFIEGMIYGLPNVTTNYGAEAMTSNDWNGFITDDFHFFTDSAVLLYNDKKVWTEKQQIGYEIFRKKFNQSKYISQLEEKIHYLQMNLTNCRNQNFIGQILQTNQVNASKYLSKWIESKQKCSF